MRRAGGSAIRFTRRMRRRARALWEMRYRRTYTSERPRVPSREELPALLNSRGLLGVGAEIGVKSGTFSDLVLRGWRGRKLISVDPWLEADASEYRDKANVPQERHEQYMEQALARLAPHGGRSEVWRTTSAEAAKRVEDESLDFVYIDARHDYDAVLEDVRLWLPKVRPGGVLAGHDYVDGVFRQGEFGVKTAVDEIFAELGIPVLSTDGKPPRFPSWIVIVPQAGVGRAS